MTVLRKKNVLGQLTKAETTGGSTYATQTWTYNGLGQMTRQTIAGQVDIEYRFSATQNDGRITHRKDWISGEEVAYLYDMRIPSDADQRSELMPIAIPISCRSPFQSDGDHRSNPRPISFGRG